MEWPLPNKPKMVPVDIVIIKNAIVEDDGFYVSNSHAVNLANNVDELKAYITKLELLLNRVSKFYKVKLIVEESN